MPQMILVVGGGVVFECDECLAPAEDALRSVLSAASEARADCDAMVVSCHERIPLPGWSLRHPIACMGPSSIPRP